MKLEQQVSSLIFCDGARVALIEGKSFFFNDTQHFNGYMVLMIWLMTQRDMLAGASASVRETVHSLVRGFVCLHNPESYDSRSFSFC